MLGEQLGEAAGPLQQLVVVALLHDVALVEDIDAVHVTKLVRDARDGVAHAIRDPLLPQDAGKSYYVLEINIMFVSLVLMARIGVPAEVQRRAANSCHLSYIVEQFNQSLADSWS